MNFLPSIRMFGAGLCLALASVASAADSNNASTPVAAPAIGDTTRAAFAIQRSGSQGGEAILLRGEEASLAHRRYLDSFTHPIPPYFSGSAGGGLGGSANGQSSSSARK